MATMLLLSRTYTTIQTIDSDASITMPAATAAILGTTYLIQRLGNEQSFTARIWPNPGINLATGVPDTVMGQDAKAMGGTGSYMELACLTVGDWTLIGYHNPNES